jgi:uncharacterized protein (DUF1501 family)
MSPSDRPRILCPDRRLFLAGMSSLSASLLMPRVASAAGARDPRFVVVILRGALDGLSAVPPVGDPAYEALRPDIAVKASGPHASLPLDATFALNPTLARLHAMVRRGEASVVHAVATGYRDRSHFDGQEALENGTSLAKGADTGWLNRAAQAMASSGRSSVRGLGIGPSVPMILRGPSPTVTWIPPRLEVAKTDTLERLSALYAAVDPELSRALDSGMETDRIASGGKMATAKDAEAAGLNRMQQSFVTLAQGCARLLINPTGPRLAALSYDGWDTHTAEGSTTGRLAWLLTGLDAAMDALRLGLGEAWKETAVVVVTEFGRTARENGADGTDHGTGAAAFLLGGAIKGGRIIADWPGLRERDLYEGRDLKPTTDLRAILKGLLADHLDIPRRALDTEVFPGSEGIKPYPGLVA